jgi:hypothetical protein
MDETHIADIWMMFKEYIDKKQLEIVAERYVDLLADYGVEDEEFKAVVGSDAVLDDAISYYLELYEEPDDEDD